MTERTFPATVYEVELTDEIRDILEKQDGLKPDIRGAMSVLPSPNKSPLRMSQGGKKALVEWLNNVKSTDQNAVQTDTLETAIEQVKNAEKLPQSAITEMKLQHQMNQYYRRDLPNE